MDDYEPQDETDYGGGEAGFVEPPPPPRSTTQERKDKVAEKVARLSGVDLAGNVIFERGDEAELGKDLADTLGPRDRVAFAEESLWRVDRTNCWEQLDDRDLQVAAHAYAGRQKWVRGREGGMVPAAIALKASAMRGIVDVAKTLRNAPLHFSEAPFGAAFGDKFVSVDGNTLRIDALTPQHRVKAEHRFPHRMREGEPVRALRLLRETWAGCADLDERIEYWFEWLGAAILGIATRYKASPMLYGPKDCGKSRVLKIAEVCFPAKARTTLSLHDMGDQQCCAALANARLNTCNELPARELLSSEPAKAVLSGDPIMVKVLYRNPFPIQSRCAHAIAANRLPPSNDSALMRRLVLLECPNVVPVAQQDPLLDAAIEREAAQIATYALLAAERLLDRGYIVKPSSAAPAAKDWEMSGDSLAAWLDEFAAPVQLVSQAMTREALYEAFCSWCETSNNRPPSLHRFSLRLRDAGVAQMRHDNRHYWMITTSEPHLRAKKAWSNTAAGGVQ